jgi:hypothetical protein
LSHRFSWCCSLLRKLSSFPSSQNSSSSQQSCVSHRSSWCCSLLREDVVELRVEQLSARLVSDGAVASALLPFSISLCLLQYGSRPPNIDP